MTPSISINEISFTQICGQAVGMRGVEVEDTEHAGTKFVLMSVEGYDQLRQLAYDDSELTAEEMVAAAQISAGGNVSGDSDAEKTSEYDDLDSSNSTP